MINLLKMFSICKAKFQKLTRQLRAIKVQNQVLKICRLDNYERPFGRRNKFWESDGKFCNGWDCGDIHIGYGIGASFCKHPGLCAIKKGVVSIEWDEKTGWECKVKDDFVELENGSWLEFLEKELPGIEKIATEFIASIKKSDEQDVLEYYQQVERELKETTDENPTGK